MPTKFNKDDYSDLFPALEFTLVFGALIILVAFAAGKLEESRTKTLELATCQEMNMNAVLDCSHAQAVAECAAANPGAECRIVR